MVVPTAIWISTRKNIRLCYSSVAQIHKNWRPVPKWLKIGATTEVNLNVGCPSDRVQNNKIGACLMAEPNLVAECIHGMQKAVSILFTVKHRIGIDDDMQSYEEMLHLLILLRQRAVLTLSCMHVLPSCRAYRRKENVKFHHYAMKMSIV